MDHDPLFVFFCTAGDEGFKMTPTPDGNPGDNEVLQKSVYLHPEALALIMHELLSVCVCVIKTKSVSYFLLSEIKTAAATLSSGQTEFSSLVKLL